MSRKSGKNRPPSDPADPTTSPEDLETGANGATTATDDGGEGTGEGETPAQVQVTMKGSDKSVRRAARRLAGDEQSKVPPVQTPANDGGDDNEDVTPLLANGKNMVIVTRQTPRKIVDPRTGRKIFTNTRLPGKYTCPTSMAAIAEQVFDEYGGSTYKCTIHPDTSSGENTILGHFKIEHPDPNAEPIVEGVNDAQPSDTSGDATDISDPTMMETDALAELNENLKRRLARANTMKEIRETERMIKSISEELDGRDDRRKESSESDEVRKLREENERLRRETEAKKIDDKFSQMQQSIADLTKTVAALVAAPARPAVSEEASIVKLMLANQDKIFTQSQQHSKEMMTLIQSQLATKHAPASDNVDVLLERFSKLQALTGGGARGGGRSSELEDRLIDMAWEQLSGGGKGDEGGEGGEGGVDVEDALKLAIKQFAPIAKTFVEKKMDQEAAASGGAPLTQETILKIQNEASAAAARKVQEDLMAQGLQLVVGGDGKLQAVPIAKKHQLPQRREPATKIVSEQRGPGGTVKKLAVEPHDLSKKKPAAAPPQSEPTKEGENDVETSTFPGIGEGGKPLKLAVPPVPGDMKYSRKQSVDFVLAGIRSDIAQGIPEKIAKGESVDNYVVSDAILYLDEQILNRLESIVDGPELEALLKECGGDAAQIAEIKKSGEREPVARYLRSLISTIQQAWVKEKAMDKGGK